MYKYIPSGTPVMARSPAGGDASRYTTTNSAPSPATRRPRKTLAIDYGTSYSAVAYQDGDQIRCVDHYEDDQMPDKNQASGNVPMIVHYPKDAKDALVTPKLFGWSIHQRLSDPMDSIYDEQSNTIQFSKLWLDDSPSTRPFRDELRVKVEHLKELDLIQEDDDICRDAVVCLLEAARECLKNDRLIDERDEFDFAISIPFQWSYDSHRRLLAVVTDAISTVFRMNKGDVVKHRYIVAEPEAAATNALWKSKGILEVGEHIMLIDAGGGTVDIVGYRITSLDPLKFEEITKPTAANCGSCFWNQAMRELVSEKIYSMQALAGSFQPRTVIDSLISAQILQHFETRSKRTINLQNTKRPTYRVHGLKLGPNTDNELVYLTEMEWQTVLGPVIATYSGLVDAQIDQLTAKGMTFDKAITTGGFSDSIMIRNATHARFSHRGFHVDHVVPRDPGSTSVAQGALRRSKARQYAPERYMRSSLGFVQMLLVPWKSDKMPDNKHFEKHPEDEPFRFQKPRMGRDGRHYFDNVLMWPCKKGAKIEPFEFSSRHVFKTLMEKWHGTEQLWISYDIMQDRFSKKCVENKSARILGTLRLSMDDAKVKAEHMLCGDEKSLVWEVNVTVRVTMAAVYGEEKHLEFSAYWAGKTADAGAEQAIDVGTAFEFY